MYYTDRNSFIRSHEVLINPLIISHANPEQTLILVQANNCLISYYMQFII